MEKLIADLLRKSADISEKFARRGCRLCLHRICDTFLHSTYYSLVILVLILMNDDAHIANNIAA